MTTSKALISLYAIIDKELGPIHAKEAVTSAIYNVISEIQEEGLEVTTDLFEGKLSSYVQDFIDISKKTNVA